MCEGWQGDVRLVGKIHILRREERIGDGRSESMGEVTCKRQQKNVGRMFRVQRECMYPKPVKDVGQVRLANHAMGGEAEGDDV